MIILKKKQVGGHKNKIFIITLFFLIFLFSRVYASQILDYETELFLESIIDDIKKANNINRKFNFKIISDNNINALVDQNNDIYITSGLIENCNDYVALLSVIAHEIGHIEKNHIKQRIIKINKIKNINTFSNLSIIAGSLISGNSEIMQGVILNSASSTGSFIKFSKNQEREADYYSIKTLEKLDLYSSSVIELLKTIEKKNLEKGITKENLKISTHPYFDERIDLINYLKQKNTKNYEISKNKKFKFIQSKFIGYNANLDRLDQLENPYKNYANSILLANEGDLNKSLKILNLLISNNKNNLFLLETKADILFSYGYTNEAIKFYEKVVRDYPNNIYSQIRIFENIDIKNLSLNKKNWLFNKNLNLIYKFYNNKNILLSYLKLVDNIKKEEWSEFLNYWLNKKNDREHIKQKLNKFKKTNDKDLLNLLNLIYNEL